MSIYTTGEIAKLCGVSVRTVQYYDTRNILTPSTLSEGGRRLYSEEDLSRMKLICFLRELDLPINTIGQLLAQEHPENVISLILEEQEKTLREEICEKQQRVNKITDLRRQLQTMEQFSLESIGDAAHIMKNKTKLKKVRMTMLATAIPFGIMEWSSIFLWIFQGVWWPFALYTLLAIPYTVWILQFYWKNVSYICPQCHRVFKPGKKEIFFAKHTPTTRKLTCTCCGHKGFCVETCSEEQDKS